MENNNAMEWYKDGKPMKKVKAVEEYRDRDGWMDKRIIEVWEDEDGRLWDQEQEWNSDWWNWVEKNNLRKVVEG